MITLAMLARAPAPGPWPSAIGTIAAISITCGHQDRPQPRVVGFDDRRVRGPARAAQLVRLVDLQNAVLLHDADQHEQAEHRVQIDRLAEQNSEIRANGIVTGSALRMAIGLSQLSNWAARIRYMKMMLNASATMK